MPATHAQETCTSFWYKFLERVSLALWYIFGMPKKLHSNLYCYIAYIIVILLEYIILWPTINAGDTCAGNLHKATFTSFYRRHYDSLCVKCTAFLVLFFHFYCMHLWKSPSVISCHVWSRQHLTHELCEITKSDEIIPVITPATPLTLTHCYWVFARSFMLEMCVHLYSTNIARNGHSDECEVRYEYIRLICYYCSFQTMLQRLCSLSLSFPVGGERGGGHCLDRIQKGPRALRVGWVDVSG